MKVKQALTWGANKLRGFDNPRLEAEVLLMHSLGWDRLQLYTNLETTILTKQYQQLVIRRQHHVPAAYLTHKREFCGFEFEVGPAVLIPRPETESLVYRAVELINQHRCQVVYDIGTGSGNIAISIAKLVPAVTVVASDIDEPSLITAKTNAVNHQVAKRIKLIKSNLVDHIKQADLIVANLPYVPGFFEVSLEVAKEPRPAIFDKASDGLGFYRQLFENEIFSNMSGQVLIELRPEQYSTMEQWLDQKYHRAKIAPIKNIDGQIWGLELDFTAAHER